MQGKDEILLTLGHLSGTVSMGFREVHRRMDDRDRFTAERYRGMSLRLSQLEKRRNGGNGEIPHIRYALLILGFLSVGTLARMAPGALRSTLFELAQKIIGGQLGVGG